MVNISEKRSLGRRQERRVGRREGILKIARAAFLSDGYAGTSMSTIASRLGGSKGTLYTYFKSKEDLFQAVLDDMLEQHTAFLAMDMAVGEPEKVLTIFCTQLVTVVLSEEGRALDRIVSGESNRFPEIGKALYAGGPRQCEEKLTAYLRDAVANGSLHIADPHLAAIQLMSMCVGLLKEKVMWTVIPSPTAEEISTHAKESVATFMAAFGR